MSSKQILTTFQRSIGQLEYFISALEKNVGQKPKQSPLIEKFGVKQSEIDTLIQQARLNKFENLDNANIQNLVKSEQPKEEVKEEKKPAQKQEQKLKQQKEKKEKKEKKEGQKKQEKKNQEPTPESLFYSLEIRVGRITEVEKVANSDKLYYEKIDIGTEVRNIASGLQQFVPIDQMSGLCFVVTNLKPVKMAGLESAGMVLCTSNEEKNKVEILRPPKDSQLGERVVLEGIAPESDSAPTPNKKLLAKVLPLLNTDAEKFARCAEIKWTLPSGLIQTDSIANGYIS